MTCDPCRELRERVRVLDAEAATLERRAAGFRRMAGEVRVLLAEHGRAHAHGLADPAQLGSWEAEASRQGVPLHG